MVDNVGNQPVPTTLPNQPGVTDRPPEEGGVTPPTINNDPMQNFEDYLNQSSITNVEQQQFQQVVDVAQEIADNSPLIDPGQNTPV
jgi:hypothetical protein